MMIKKFIKKNYGLLLGIGFLLGIVVMPYLLTNIHAESTFEPDNSSGVAVCDEQLQLCVNEFNSLLADFKNGTNCNTETFNQLKQMNHDVSADRERYREEAESLKPYKPAFYTTFIILFAWIIFFMFANRKSKTGRLTNARKAGTKGKKANS